MRIFEKTGHVYFVGTSWKLVPFELICVWPVLEEIRASCMQLRRLSLEGIQGGGGFPLRIPSRWCQNHNHSSILSYLLKANVIYKQVPFVSALKQNRKRREKRENKRERGREVHGKGRRRT